MASHMDYPFVCTERARSSLESQTNVDIRDQSRCGSSDRRVVVKFIVSIEIECRCVARNRRHTPRRDHYRRPDIVIVCETSAVRGIGIDGVFGQKRDGSIPLNLTSNQMLHHQSADHLKYQQIACMHDSLPSRWPSPIQYKLSRRHRRHQSQ